MRKTIFFITIIFLGFMTMVDNSAMSDEKKKTPFSNPKNCHWETPGVLILPRLKIVVTPPADYEGDGEVIVYLTDENENVFPSWRANIHKHLVNGKLIYYFPDNFPIGFRGREYNYRIQGRYYLKLYANNRQIRENNYSFLLFLENSDYYRFSRKFIVPFEKAEFYDFSNLDVNVLNQNPKWKVELILDYEIKLCFGEKGRYEGRGKYRGKGYVKSVIIGPEGEKYISETERLPKKERLQFIFPSNFYLSGKKGHFETKIGYHKYYFIVDGVKIDTGDTGFILVEHRDDKTKPRCDIIHLYDCNELLDSFPKERRNIEKKYQKVKK